ncbi:MAG: hypothetical protein RLZZ350_1959 [Verrucomicrobiota bacterium]
MTEAALAAARTNGLVFTNLPSIGSGLDAIGTNEFVGITDRGPNGTVGSRRTFPLPEFSPTIIRFKLAGTNIVPTQFIVLKDTHGKPVSGVSNVKGDELLFQTGDATNALSFDENGVDPEGIRVLPDGKFLLCEEYSPSIFVVATNGEILVRYTPISKSLPRATYPVKNILPNEFALRRVNKGFEALALSRDGRTAYALLQTPMGDDKDVRYEASQVVRVLKLDVSDPLAARVTGELLVRTGDATNYSAKVKPAKISFGDAAWLATDKLLLVEHAKGAVRLVSADFSHATDVLHHPQAHELFFEDVTTDLAQEKIQTAVTKEVFTTRTTPGISSGKLEGLAVLSRDEVALANDNDFGIGDAGEEESCVWRVRLAAPLW